MAIAITVERGNITDGLRHREDEKVLLKGEKSPMKRTVWRAHFEGTRRTCCIVEDRLRWLGWDDVELIWKEW